MDIKSFGWREIFVDEEDEAMGGWIWVPQGRETEVAKVCSGAAPGLILREPWNGRVYPEEPKRWVAEDGEGPAYFDAVRQAAMAVS